MSVKQGVMGDTDASASARAATPSGRNPQAVSGKAGIAIAGHTRGPRPYEITITERGTGFGWQIEIGEAVIAQSQGLSFQYQLEAFGAAKAWAWQHEQLGYDFRPEWWNPAPVAKATDLIDELIEALEEARELIHHECCEAATAADDPELPDDELDAGASPVHCQECRAATAALSKVRAQSEARS